jgi:signal transduction histidine kinase
MVTRQWLREHPMVVDAYAAFFLFLLSVPSEVRRPAGPLAARAVLAAAMCLPLVVRRRHPTWAFAAVASVAFYQWVIDVQVRPHDIAILLALYTVAAYGRRRDAVLALATVLGGVALMAVRWQGSHFAPALVAPTALAIAATVAGDDIRTRRAHLAGLTERAERLERERDALAEVAAAAERSRIARELHDVVAHNLSVMVAQADGAAYALDDDPARARRAMETVAETGRGALSEMRRLLGVLRSPLSATERSPQPGVDRLPDLVAGVREAGLEVELEVVGQAVEVSPGLGLTLFRVVQEALTNTLKHAGPHASSRVQVRFDAASMNVVVTDDGGLVPAGAPPRVLGAADDAGQGLAGMRERVTLYEGSLATGPRREGGFEVRASFPLRASAAR